MAGLSILPVAPWEAPRRKGAPPISCQIFTTLFWRLNVHCIRLNVTTTKKGRQLFWEKSAPPQIRKSWLHVREKGSRMVNPALFTSEPLVAETVIPCEVNLMSDIGSSALYNQVTNEQMNFTAWKHSQVGRKTWRYDMIFNVRSTPTSGRVSPPYDIKMKCSQATTERNQPAKRLQCVIFYNNTNNKYSNIMHDPYRVDQGSKCVEGNYCTTSTCALLANSNINETRKKTFLHSNRYVNSKLCVDILVVYWTVTMVWSGGI